MANTGSTDKTVSASQRRRQKKLASSQQRQSQQHKRRKTRRRDNSNLRSWLITGGVVLVLALIIGFFVYLSRLPSSNTNTGPKPVSATVLQAVTQIDPKVLVAVGNGGTQNGPRAVKGEPPLTGPTGKPEFFYAGAEYCPFCAAARWPVVIALSRFGTFQHLSTTTSAPEPESFPNTATFTFYGSTYSSPYIDFVSLEEQGNQPDSSGRYATLQTPTPQQQQLLTKYDAPPYVSGSSAGAIPFVDIANQYFMSGSPYSPSALASLSPEDIASELSNPNSNVTKGVIGAANNFTAALCVVTKMQPAQVCQADPIPGLISALNKTTFDGSMLADITGASESIIDNKQKRKYS